MRLCFTYLQDAGKRIKDIIGDESITCYVSPFMRSKQTFEAAKAAFLPEQVFNMPR